MRVRDRFLLCAMVAAVLAAAVAHGAAGIPADALIAVPALLLLLPLAAGRYVGSARLARLARRAPRPPPARRPSPAPGGRRARRRSPPARPATGPTRRPPDRRLPRSARSSGERCRPLIAGAPLIHP